MKFEVYESYVRDIELSGRISERAKKQRRVFFTISLVLIVLLFEGTGLLRTILNIFPSKDIKEATTALEEARAGIFPVIWIYVYYFVSFVWFFRQTLIAEDNTNVARFYVRATGLKQWLSTNHRVSDPLKSYVVWQANLYRAFCTVFEFNPANTQTYVTQLTPTISHQSRPYSPDGSEYVLVSNMNAFCTEGVTHQINTDLGRDRAVTLVGDQDKYDSNMKQIKYGCLRQLVLALLKSPSMWVEFWIPFALFWFVLFAGLLPILYGQPWWKILIVSPVLVLVSGIILYFRDCWKTTRQNNESSVAS